MNVVAVRLARIRLRNDLVLSQGFLALRTHQIVRLDTAIDSCSDRMQTYDLSVDRVCVDLGRFIVDQRLVLLHVLLVLGELLLALLALLVDRPQLFIDGLAISILEPGERAMSVFSGLTTVGASFKSTHRLGQRLFLVVGVFERALDLLVERRLLLLARLDNQF